MYIWPFDISPGASHGDAIPAAGPGSPSVARAGTGLPAGLTKFLRDNYIPRRRIVLPGDPSYNEDRTSFNARFDRVRPWAIIYCDAEREVATCLEAVRKYKVRFRVRSGGHSFAGYSALDDGIVIDVSGLHNLCVDPARAEVTAGSGCTMALLQAALKGSGLHLPLGGGPVGVAGFVQGGGFGGSSRTFGMNSDSVVALRMMLADGRIVSASEAVNHDLWWAVRGGTGGNFGVLLEVRYGLHRAAAPNTWEFAWRLSQPEDKAKAARVLVTLQDILRKAGPEFNAGADLRYWPETDNGEPTALRLYLWGSYFGSESDMNRLIQTLKDVPGAKDFDQYPIGRMSILRQARFVSELGEQDWKAIVDDFADRANPHSTLTMNAFGGAINSYPPEKSAFVHRNAVFNLYVTGFWEDSREEQKMLEYLKGWRQLVAPFWTSGIYQNFSDPDCPDYRSNYWGAALPALVAVRQKYDPSGLFRFPQMIESLPGQPPQPPTWPPLVASWLKRPIEI